MTMGRRLIYTVGAGVGLSEYSNISSSSDDEQCKGEVIQNVDEVAMLSGDCLIGKSDTHKSQGSYRVLG